MKIEIGESLLSSYLKHVKNCIIVQTNWKVSSNWNLDENRMDEVDLIYHNIKKHNEFSEIFKSDLSQIIKQAEIDVIGIDNTDTLYMAEVAFHENGLQYGGKIDTKNRVIKKLLRAYMTAVYFFPDKQYNIIFASPKVNNATQVIIDDYFHVLNTDFAMENVKFNFISNDNFKSDILIPTINAIQTESDTSELFSRSFKLLDLFNLTKPNDKNSTQLATETEQINISKQTLLLNNDSVENNVKFDKNNSLSIDKYVEIKGIRIQLLKNTGESIQDFIKRTLNLMLHGKLIPETEIVKLLNPEYCKKTFYLQFPLLQTDSLKTIDASGRSRYWKNKFDRKYYVCSQWWIANESIYESKWMNLE